VPPDRSGELPEAPKGIAVEAGTQLDLTDAVAEADVDAQVAAAKFVDDNTSTYVDPEPVYAAAVVSHGPGTATAAATTAAEASLGDLMGDAPACSACGHMTVRSGSCYVCLTCGDTTGCS
jgi:ribonucleoside-diphosphate reductase alpha chain